MHLHTHGANTLMIKRDHELDKEDAYLVPSNLLRNN